ncbi:MAG: hypothetical protein LUC30_07415 [Clostridiales bacterium]|nr:hypothetical protein [Clostridiales bacterium]
MKKAYIAPALEVELFQLNTAIASGCTTTVDFGPDPSQNDGGKTCEYFGDPFAVSAAADGPIVFYESDSSTCDCYYSSGDMNYVTS